MDSSGNAYVTGTTDSANFPTLNPLQATYGGDTCTGFSPYYGSPCSDVFVTKFSAVTKGPLPPAPVLFSLSGDGQGQGAIWHAGTGKIASSANPATAGDVMSRYATTCLKTASFPRK